MRFGLGLMASGDAAGCLVTAAQQRTIRNCNDTPRVDRKLLRALAGAIISDARIQTMPI
jgi:hypothetical protein